MLQTIAALTAEKEANVKNVEQLRKVVGDRLHESFFDDLAADMAHSATMSMLLPPQMLNTMAPAVEPFRAALDEVELREPRFEVFSCASAAPFSDVREELATALVRPVRWRETVLALGAAGVESYVDVGPGKVLARLMKRIEPGLKAQSPNFEEAAGV